MGPLGPRPPAFTDASGAFAFANLPAGPYSLSAEKPTYLPGRYPEPGRSMRDSGRPIVVRDGQVIDGVTVSIARGSAIAGRVVDAYGDPVEHAEARVMRLPRSGRDGRPAMRGGSSTNDLGEFRVGRLEAGSYLLMVVPRNVRPDEPSDAQPVATYYPGVAAIDQAQPITLARGESLTGLEIMLVEGETALVSGIVVDARGQPMSVGGHVSARPIMKDVASGWGWEAGGTSVRPDGTFRLKLPPGEYQLDAYSMRPGVSGQVRPGDEQFGTVRVSVGGESVAGVTIALGSGAKVSGRVVFDGQSPIPSDPEQLQVAFVADGPGCRPGRRELGRNWTFTIDGLSGTCIPRVFGGIGRWTVKAILHEGMDLLERPTTFEPGQHLRDVQVILTDRRTELAFQVVDERGRPTRDYVALVFPADKARWLEGAWFVRTYVPQPLLDQVVGPSKSGTPAAPRVRRDSVSGLPPGEYYAVAIDDIDPEDVRDPALLDRLAPDAVRVTLGDGAGLEVSLRRLTLHDSR